MVDKTRVYEYDGSHYAQPFEYMEDSEEKEKLRLHRERVDRLKAKALVAAKYEATKLEVAKYETDQKKAIEAFKLMKQTQADTQEAQVTKVNRYACPSWGKWE